MIIWVINLTSKYSVQSCCHLVWGQFWLYLLYTFRIEIGIEIDLFLPKDRKIDLQKIRSFLPLYRYCSYLLPKQALTTFSEQQEQNIANKGMKSAVYAFPGHITWTCWKFEDLEGRIDPTGAWSSHNRKGRVWQARSTEIRVAEGQSKRKQKSFEGENIAGRAEWGKVGSEQERQSPWCRRSPQRYRMVTISGNQCWSTTLHRVPSTQSGGFVAYLVGSSIISYLPAEL